MDMGRTAMTVIGSRLAAAAVAQWEAELKPVRAPDWGNCRVALYATGADGCMFDAVASLGRSSSTAVTPSEKFCVNISTM